MPDLASRTKEGLPASHPTSTASMAALSASRSILPPYHHPRRYCRPRFLLKGCGLAFDELAKSFRQIISLRDGLSVRVAHRLAPRRGVVADSRMNESLIVEGPDVGRDQLVALPVVKDGAKHGMLLRELLQVLSLGCFPVLFTVLRHGHP